MDKILQQKSMDRADCNEVRLEIFRFAHFTLKIHMRGEITHTLGNTRIYIVGLLCKK